MHAAVDRTGGTRGEALFFADLPDSAGEHQLIQPAEERSAYGASRKPNWPAILLIAALHAVTFIALVKFDVIQIHKKPPPLKVFDVVEIAPPPAVEPPKPQPRAEPIVPLVTTPTPMVQTITPPPPIVVAPPPSKPAPIVAPAAPPAPMSVDNLEDRMIAGNPPRYPMESRRKKEQGTVVLRLVIGTDGRVEEVSIAQSSGFDRLDQAALQAARSWRWQPMTRGGQPVQVRGVMSIPFVLKA
jgi:protein TonB